MDRALFNLVSLGCPKNRVDSERILATLTAQGWQHVEDPAAAAVIVINTCAFIEPAVEESIDVILDSCAENPDAFVVVAGCLPLRYSEELRASLPEVRLFITPDMIDRLPDLFKKAGARTPGRKGPGKRPAATRTLTTPGYAYLRIADGCSRRCRYCTIPKIRGPAASVPPERLLAEAGELVAMGAKELVLVAQDLTRYGKDLASDTSLAGLLGRLDRTDGVRWIRLMYLHPEGVDSALIEAINSCERVLPYLDIPFQHVSDKVLKAMGRPAKGDRIRRLVERLRRQIPDLALRTTFMVGFPAEGDSEFEELSEFVRSFQIENVGVFSYCPEEGTPAFGLGDPVPSQEKQRRAQALLEIQAAIQHKRSRGLIRTVQLALVEGVSDESEFLLRARTRHQAPEVDGVLYVTSGNAVAGDMHRVRITDAYGPDLFGEIVS